MKASVEKVRISESLLLLSINRHGKSRESTVTRLDFLVAVCSVVRRDRKAHNQVADWKHYQMLAVTVKLWCECSGGCPIRS
jgi:hypothetical protein